MAVPFDITLPVPGGSTDAWGSAINNALGAIKARINTEAAARGVPLDAFAGATDDAKLTQALSYVAQQTYKPAIVLGQRSMEFKQTRQAFNGLAFTGPLTGNEFRYNQRVRISVPGSGWLDLPSGQTKGLYIGNLSFEGDSGTTFFVDHDNAGPVLWASHFENLAFNLFKHVMWGAHTAVTFSGFWDVNNSYDTPFKLWGSDNTYWTDGMLIDSPNMGGGNRYHVWLPNMSKTVVGPIFITAKSNICGLRLDGGRGVVMDGIRFDAQAQAGNPTWGSQLLITGGKFVRVRDCWFYGGMSQPNSTGHTNPAYDKGILTITGGTNILVDGPMFSDGDGSQPNKTAAGAPHIYIGGGSNIRIRDVQASDTPTIKRASSVSAGTITTDPDITVQVG
ncbi:hypothetical protein [Actinomadura violacea]|uniref:Uncharacterized protein n=1 Tax=Actinomadura violacea TaxID=2819934 RepID=A0ABS3RX27_9ACTN|nr:hypothetical protein [Actinomadura violacea]MBO2461196.1 hypothetical protein [Actinomadura violacea]